MRMTEPLTNKKVAIVVGHEAGGGAAGEREYNLVVANHLAGILTGRGATVYVHHHKLSNYSDRMAEMREAIETNLPNSDATIELHYNSYDTPNAQGHEFFYLGSKALAESIRDEFQDDYGFSRPRQSNGIAKLESGDGAGFLRAAPSWACLVEPFFNSNKAEWDYFKDRHFKLATTYANGLTNFLIDHA